MKFDMKQRLRIETNGSNSDCDDHLRASLEEDQDKGSIDVAETVLAEENQTRLVDANNVDSTWIPLPERVLHSEFSLLPPSDEVEIPKILVKPV